jgi:N-acetylneuraminic acid mutarotase
VFHRRAVALSLLAAAVLGLVAPPVSAAPAGRWAPTGSLRAFRDFHTATRLGDGSVLVAGGSTGGPATVKAERYDPAAGVWTATGSLTTPRESHTATALTDGHVLVAGGLTIPPPGFAAQSTPTVELYDPATGTWASTGSMLDGMIGHTATLLPDGRVLVAGGSTYVGLGAIGRAELYDPSTGAWTETGSLQTARWNHSAALLADGRVLVAGGITADGAVTSTAEVFDPATGLWTTTGSTHLRWQGAEALRLAGGRVLLLNGSTETADTSPAPELYDPATGSWTTTAAPHTSRVFSSATLLADGRVLVAAGGLAGKKGITATAELYDPTSGRWSATGAVAVIRRMQTATLLADGTVLIVGGETTGGKRTASAEVFTPPPPADVRTTTVLASSANPSAAGQPVTFTATVSPVSPGAAVAGTVTFTNGAGTVLCKKVKVTANQAACTKKLRTGTYAVTAVFTARTAAGNSASAPLQQLVRK